MLTPDSPGSNASTPSIGHSVNSTPNEWAVPDIPDFVPQNYEASHMVREYLENECVSIFCEGRSPLDQGSCRYHWFYEI